MTTTDVQHVSRTARPGGGPGGNERLTAATGAVLLVLLAAQGVTVLFIGRLLPYHFFIGLLLIGPVCLKIASTGHRFVRYHTGSPAYRREGPPAPWLRVLGPLVVATTLCLLTTGVTVGLCGPRVGPLPVLFLHKAAFVCWVTVTSLHVLARVWRLPRLIAGDLGRSGSRHGAPAPGGTAARWTLLAGSLCVGTAVALAVAPLAEARWGR